MLRTGFWLRVVRRELAGTEPLVVLRLLAEGGIVQSKCRRLRCYVYFFVRKDTDANNRHEEDLAQRHNSECRDAYAARGLWYDCYPWFLVPRLKQAG